MWHIWKTRCAKPFFNTTVNVDVVANSIVMQMNECKRVLHAPRQLNNPMRQIQHQRSPPSNDVEKINFDVSHMDDNNPQNEDLSIGILQETIMDCEEAHYMALIQNNLKLNHF